MARIGLCMIVKNEAHVILRCLASALRLLDYAYIVDTGSTDGTPALIRDFLTHSRLPGEVVEAPWRNFAYNRNLALAGLRARNDIEYGLMIDADEVLEYETGFDPVEFKRELHSDLYDVRTRLGNIVYLRPQLFSNRIEFVSKAVLHEYLDCAHAFSRQIATGFYNRPQPDGCRSRNPHKFRDDAQVLETALNTETDPFLVARYTFYLAQSYRDGGEQAKALAAYLRRAGQGYWDQEVFVSLYSAAKLQEQLGHSDSEIIQTHLAAFEICPTRAEALHGAGRLCRLRGKHQQGYILTKHGIGLDCPPEGLFVEQWIYEYGLKDEFSVLAYWAGQFRESFDACVSLLACSALPQSERDRVRKNADFALAKLEDAQWAERLSGA